MSMRQLQARLGYTFTDVGLLQQAVTHRSVGSTNNERLEFLGDSVVNQIIAEAIFRRFPRASEGSMSRMRASLVKGDTLAELARELDLGDYLVLGSGERRSGGFRRSSILADAFEAVLGAMLLDSDYEKVRTLVLSWFESRLQKIDADGGKDAKTRLQELLQGKGKPLPEYVLVEVCGEDHAQQFEVKCQLLGSAISAVGVGSSRRKAEQIAAKGVLEQLV